MKYFIATILSVALVVSGCSFGSKEKITVEDHAAQKREVYKQAMEYLDAEKNAEALESFNELVRLDPSVVEAYLNRGIVYGKLRQLDLAIADFTSVIEMEADADDAYFNRGFVYSKKKEYEKALVDFDKALELNPRAGYVYLRRGTVYGQLEDFEKALADFEEAIKFDPKDHTVHKQKGVVYLLQKKEAQSMKSFKEAAELGSPYAQELLKKKGIPFALPNPKADQVTSSIDIVSPETEK